MHLFCIERSRGGGVHIQCRMDEALSVLLLGEKPSLLTFIQSDFFFRKFPGNNIAQKATEDEKNGDSKIPAKLRCSCCANGHTRIS